MMLPQSVAWATASDMAKHSISEASKITGKARSTLHRHLKSGKLSKEIDADGQPVIDTAELVRVYGLLHGKDSSATVPIGQQATPQSDSLLQAKIEAMMEAQIEQLRADLDDARKERDDWKAQAQRLSGLLSDQRPIATTAPAPAQQETTSSILRSLLHRFGRKP